MFKVKLEVPPLQKVVCVQEVDWGRFQVPPEGRVARQLGKRHSYIGMFVRFMSTHGQMRRKLGQL